ncbi:hypothetical protein QZN10_39680 [Burkholderia contaminans]|jgi:hypothetical protein|uniref:hypothetical protein n=1 Tax=Burkholderia contaminans TaxID=488447 RepID=UPI00128E70B9|nr:hypothetical protein [Burkholderia contaminans]MDN8026743.1 hypothetical protein [Burkholderia contaminans]
MKHKENKQSFIGKVATAPFRAVNLVVKPVYTPVVNQVKESKERLTPLFKFLDPRNVAKIKANARIETYEEAKARLNVTESDIDKNYRNFSVISYIALVSFIVALGFITYNLTKHEFFNASTWFFLLSISFANAVKFSFRAYQLKTHQLCSFSVFANDKFNWLPTFRR